ncbi:PleD family two-component system response regulator [Streptomyces althioticus]|uniref:hypothetical protein n=1 Tax=Streptomyces althioticus TaxID=83380 RepID=UPI0037FC32DD
MTSARVSTYQVLVVDDDPQMIQRVKEVLREDLPESLRNIEFSETEEFEAAQSLLEQEDFDLVVLDVRDAPNGRPAAQYEARGHDLYKAIAGTRWLPVVFFTGVPERVRDLEARPLVSVVVKNDLDGLAPAVEAGLRSGVSDLRRRITNLVETKARAFLGKTVAPFWQEFAGADPDELAMVIVNRLAAELRENGLAELGYARDETWDPSERASAARVYLKPTVTEHLTATDLLVDDKDDWWIVLTPACDLHEDDPKKVAKPRTAKAEYVRLAKADRVLTEDELSESPAIRRLLESARSNRDKDAAKAVFGDGQNRYRYLPGFLDIPDLLVDFENVKSVELREARRYRRAATLDSPFSEAMLSAYGRSAGRIGTPDVSTAEILTRLGISKQKKAPTMPKQSTGPLADGEPVRD